MSPKPTATALDWMEAKSLLPCVSAFEPGLHGALVPDSYDENDHIAVVFNKGETPPEITIHEVSGSVHTVCANGIAIAVVASATGPAPSADDVLLVERYI